MTIDSAKIEGDLVARSRCSGDRILSGGMHKSIKKLMCDKKIPTDIRDVLPVVRQDGDVVYVPKCAVADTVKVQGHNAEIIIAIYTRTA